MAFYIFPRALSKPDCDKYLKYCLKNAKWQDASTVAKGHADVVDKDITKDELEKTQHFDSKLRKTDVSWITDKDLSLIHI